MYVKNLFYEIEGTANTDDITPVWYLGIDSTPHVTASNIFYGGGDSAKQILPADYRHAT